MLGSTIGQYEIVEELGEGGMGAVYKARDKRLDRFVAIKVLKPRKLADEGHKRRFIQEAKTASALSHPNIIHIYDIGDLEGVDYIVMELVEGKTLDRLIPRHGVRVADALRYAVQIADGLARAHAAGIVHRDLKPNNVMVTEQGLVKLLDFGLAKLTQAPADSEADATRTLRMPVTEEGTIVGTVGYMSPEQAEGKTVDARSDIFSFGSLLYEMLTGRRAFQGDSKASILAAILREEPKPASQIVRDLPGDLDRLLRRCLRKDPAQRMQHMDDIKLTLEDLSQDVDSGTFASTAPAQPERRRRRWVISAGAILLVAAFAAAWIVRSRWGTEEPEMVTVPLTSYAGTQDSPTFSPDGTQVAFSWCKPNEPYACAIYVKEIGVEPPSRLTPDGATDCCPAWSPDGRSIAFIRWFRPPRFSVIVVPQRGGREQVLFEADVGRASVWATPPQRSGSYVAWTPDSKWLAIPVPDGTAWALSLVGASTGEVRRLTRPGDVYGDAAPAFSPDGKALMFARESTDFTADLYLLHLGETYTPVGEPEKLSLPKPWNLGAVWLPGGSEVVFSSGNFNPIFNAGLSADLGLWRLSISQPAKLQRLPSSHNASAPAISQRTGRLAYAFRRYDNNIWRIALDEAGAARPIQFISSTQPDYNPDYSRDGKSIAFVSERSGTAQIWTCESDGSNAVQLTSSAHNPLGPRWSPDGRSIVFWENSKGRTEIYVISANGGAPRHLENTPDGGQWPYWSKDGRSLYFAGASKQIWRMAAAGGQPVRLTQNGGEFPQESHDGRFVYYQKGWPYDVTLWRMPVQGGTETRLIEGIDPFAEFEVADDGVWYATRADERGRSDIALYEFATGKTRKLITTERRVFLKLAVSPDRRTLLYSQEDEVGSELMLVENFR